VSVPVLNMPRAAWRTKALNQRPLSKSNGSAWIHRLTFRVLPA
jgi:hypothetical protein